MERVYELVEPLLAAHDVEVVDVEQLGATLRVTVDRPGGIDLDAVSEATLVVSDALDRHDPLPGRYTLEVSSPGLERPLRTPAHFQRFVGSDVAVKTKADVEGDRRVEGTLESADDTGFVVAGRRLSYADVEPARTRSTPAASASSSPESSSRRTSGTPCSISTGWRPCSRRPSRCPTSTTTATLG